MLHGIPSTAAIPMDLHLEGDTIFTLPITLRQTPTLTQCLDTPIARHLAADIFHPSQNHSLRVLTSSNQTKSKSSMKPPEGIAKFVVLVLQTLLSKIKIVASFVRYFLCSINTVGVVYNISINRLTQIKRLRIFSLRQSVYFKFTSLKIYCH